MPVITPDTLRESNRLPDTENNQTPRKAYKSPHSRVPWKRAINSKQSNPRVAHEGDQTINYKLPSNLLSDKSSEVIMDGRADSNKPRGNAVRNVNHPKEMDGLSSNEISSKKTASPSDENEEIKPLSVLKRRQSVV